VRIVSFNIENLAPWIRDDDGMRRLRHLVEDLDAPDVLCLQEIRVRAGDDDLVERMHRALRGYVCHASLPRDPRNVSYRGGRAYGVATYVRSTLRPEPAHVPEWDREGRVVVTPLRAFTVINVYLVNGTSRPWFDPDTGKVDGDRHAFKRRLQRLLMAEAKSHGDVVIIGDFNVSRTRIDVHPRLRTEGPHALARKELNEIVIPELDVVDVFRELHPTERKYTWFEKRAASMGRLDAARVDYALVSRALASRVKEADIAQEMANRFGSDHAPLFIDVDPGTRPSAREPKAPANRLSADRRAPSTTRSGRRGGRR